MRYVLADPLLQFWFRFVFPNLHTIANLGPERAFEARIRPGLDAWYGACFESMCREALPWIYAREGAELSSHGEYAGRRISASARAGPSQPPTPSPLAHPQARRSSHST